MSVGRGPYQYITSAKLTARVMEGYLERQGACNRREDLGQDENSANLQGSMLQLAEQIARMLPGGNAGSVYRRLAHLRAGTTNAVNVGLADALCLAIGSTMEQEGLPTLPATTRAAREMAETFADIRGTNATTAETARLAKLLLAFTTAFLHDLTMVPSAAISAVVGSIRPPEENLASAA